jgi:hypothetical protein
MYRAVPALSLRDDQKVSGLLQDAVTLTLVHRAELLHRRSKSGLDPAAATLKVTRLWHQVSLDDRKAPRCLCHVHLSDGSKHRAAWLWRESEATLHGFWSRVAYAEAVPPRK